MAVLGIVGGYKVFEVFKLQRIFFEGVVNIGSVIIHPYFFCPRVLAAGFAVEKDYVCFYAIGGEMPVGKRRMVCRSMVSSNFLRKVSPPPPSNKTLSGNTTAAWPVVFSMLFICCTKLSCLLLVVTQKSCRL